MKISRLPNISAIERTVRHTTRLFKGKLPARLQLTVTPLLWSQGVTTAQVQHWLDDRFERPVSKKYPEIKPSIHLEDKVLTVVVVVDGIKSYSILTHKYTSLLSGRVVTCCGSIVSKNVKKEWEVTNPLF